jgi:hypothetical protein
MSPRSGSIHLGWRMCITHVSGPAVFGERPYSVVGPRLSPESGIASRNRLPDSPAGFASA